MTVTIDEQIAAVKALIAETEVSASGFRKWVGAGNFDKLRGVLATLESCQWRDIESAPQEASR